MFAGGAKKLFGRGPVELLGETRGQARGQTRRPRGEARGQPGETPAEPGGPRPTDPATVEFPAGTAYEKFQWIKQQVLAAPPGQRVQTARNPFQQDARRNRQRLECDAVRATNGTYWKDDM